MAHLANTLQIPIAVPVNRVGNTTEFAIQTKLNALEIPYLVRSTNNGIHPKFDYPKNIISEHPINEIVRGPIKAGLNPPNLKINPEVIKPRLSAIEVDIEFVKMSPGRYLSWKVIR